MAETVSELIPAGGGRGFSEIKKFADSHLQESIDAALAGVNPGHGNAIVDVDTEGAKAVILQRIDDSWSIIAIGQVHWHGKPDFEVAVRKTW